MATIVSGPTIYSAFRLDNGQEIEGEMDLLVTDESDTNHGFKAWINSIEIDTTRPISRIIYIDDEE